MRPDLRRVVVLAALQEEVVDFASGDRLEVIVCGVGKVAAAIAAQRACDVLAPRALISIGLAGGVESSTASGTVIVASAAVQHDFDARPLTAVRGGVVLQSRSDVSERLGAAAGSIAGD